MTIAYNARVVTDGLALYVDALNTRSYSGTGTVWKNLNGSLPDADATGPAVYSSNGYFSFSGTSYFDSLLPTPYDTTTLVNRTIGAWYRCTSASTQAQALIVVFNGVSNPQFEMLVSTTGLTISTNTNSTTGTTAVAVALNTWYYAVATESHSGGIRTLNMYLNGTLVATRTNTDVVYTAGADRVRLGCQKDSVPRTLLGDIGNAQFYTRALSAQEVLQNFNALRGRYGI